MKKPEAVEKELSAMEKFIQDSGESSQYCYDHHLSSSAVPLFRRLVCVRSPQRAGFDPNPNHVGFWCTKWRRGRFFSPSTSVCFPLSVRCHHLPTTPYNLSHWQCPWINTFLFSRQFHCCQWTRSDAHPVRTKWMWRVPPQAMGLRSE
jgi:hypothetical protein